MRSVNFKITNVELKDKLNDSLVLTTRKACNIVLRLSGLNIGLAPGWMSEVGGWRGKVRRSFLLSEVGGWRLEGRVGQKEM